MFQQHCLQLAQEERLSNVLYIYAPHCDLKFRLYQRFFLNES